jgi:hypothetical protein
MQEKKEIIKTTKIMRFNRNWDRKLLKNPRLLTLIKAADLNIDLRKVFIKNDPLELSIIPRIKFWDILSSLPLGLSDNDLKEIFLAKEE